MPLAYGSGTEPAENIGARTTPVAGNAAGRACPVVPPVCCAMLLSLPLGIVAMLFSLRSRAALAEGDAHRAAVARRRSVFFSWVSVAWAAFMAVLLLILTMT